MQLKRALSVILSLALFLAPTAVFASAQEGEKIVLEDMLTYPDGKKWALTLSYDDGCPMDVELVEVLNRYGVKCTFNLIAKNTKTNNWAVPSGQVASLYEGHEIANHTWSHPNLKDLPAEQMRAELEDAKAYLESLSGYDVRGLAYPYGTGCYNDDVFATMEELGIVYGRTTSSTHFFRVPENFLLWDPTATNTEGTNALKLTFNKFIIKDRGIFKNLFYLWGHSFEFSQENGGFAVMEDFCEMASEHSDKIWFATNIEIYDYITAVRQAVLSEDGTQVTNNADLDIWINDGGSAVCIGAGQTYTLGSGNT